MNDWETGLLAANLCFWILVTFRMAKDRDTLADAFRATQEDWRYKDRCDEIKGTLNVMNTKYEFMKGQVTHLDNEVKMCRDWMHEVMEDPERIKDYSFVVSGCDLIGEDVPDHVRA